MVVNFLTFPAGPTSALVLTSFRAARSGVGVFPKWFERGEPFQLPSLDLLFGDISLGECSDVDFDSWPVLGY